ncbi:nucleoside hydrolase 3-like [Salvia miltiorrhiza]|uniref:nucleoside hydrolase 3-like n=1 Tax=Salvia miltiorrhiza TaxID=226208 RepID=UPI0025AC9CF8|nr:nucleoside hydrolase 3-like [Salvia miltiorrhiza]
MMMRERDACICICILIVITALIRSNTNNVEELRRRRRILLDTDMDTDDLFALLYILKLNTSHFDLQAVTINTNGWSNAGHAVNHVYDLLHMMGRDDVVVGLGGEGGILEDGTMQPDIGGYHPIIEQGNSTAGYCRYRQAIPLGHGGRLDVDTNFGLRRSFLPQGSRRYLPLQQPTVQQVMVDKILAGPMTVFVIGASTNLAVFLMSNPHLKKNIQHIYIMGGGVGTSSPARSPEQPGPADGNLFTGFSSNPYAEFNMFADPFAAYQVIHSGIPVTLVPLDATNTIPMSVNFYEEFEKNQHTFEAQYCFKSLQMNRYMRQDDYFFKDYSMWDSFLAGVATSIMLKENNTNGENDFAEMEYKNITVITSNAPYGKPDASNPLFRGLEKPRFDLDMDGVHSGHVQTGLRDPFCIVKNGKGRCKDGYTAEVAGKEGVRVLVAVRAKPSNDSNSKLEKEYFRSFLDVLNRKEQTAKFNFTKQFLHHREVFYKPDLEGRQLGKNVVFDMDMSAGDFLALFYLLKLPVEVINLKGILVTPTGWANAATIDVVYDVLHMMGRDDIPVGLGDFFALNQSDPSFSDAGDCKYSKAIPQGSGGLLDSDTLYGLARDLPRSPRRYTAENSMRFGAPRDTAHPELRQPLALEIWQSVIKSLKPGSKVTVLTNGPLTNVANIILSDKNLSSHIEEIFVVGGRIRGREIEKRNVINIHSNEDAELNMFLDPLAAKTVFESRHNITLIPLHVQRRVSRLDEALERLHATGKTPEALFTTRLLSRMVRLRRTHDRYQHVEMFLGEILGAVVVAGNDSYLKTTYGMRKVKVLENGALSEDGEMSSVRVVDDVDSSACYDSFAARLGGKEQSAVIGSFGEQRRLWSSPQKSSKRPCLT